MAPLDKLKKKNQPQISVALLRMKPMSHDKAQMDAMSNTHGDMNMMDQKPTNNATPDTAKTLPKVVRIRLVPNQRRVIRLLENSRIFLTMLVRTTLPHTSFIGTLLALILQSSTSSLAKSMMTLLNRLMVLLKVSASLIRWLILSLASPTNAMA